MSKNFTSKQSEEKKLVAFRGYYVFVNDFVNQLNELIADAEKSYNAIAVLGNPAKIKLEGALMSLRGMKEMLYGLEKYGNLILLPIPEKEDTPNVDTVGEDAIPQTPKLILPS